MTRTIGSGPDCVTTPVVSLNVWGKTVSCNQTRTDAARAVTEASTPTWVSAEG